MYHLINDIHCYMLIDFIIITFISDNVEAASYPNKERFRVSLFTDSTDSTIVSISNFGSQPISFYLTMYLYYIVVQTILLQNFRLTHDFHQPSSSG